MQRSVRGAQPQSQLDLATPEKFDNPDPTRPNNINVKTKQINKRASSSMGMARILSSTQPVSKTQRTNKFIANSGAQMSKLADLDRRTKYATIKAQSNIFNSTMPTPARENLDNMKRKGGAGVGTKASMGGIMAHDEGPYSKLDWPSKKGAVTDKATSQNTKQIKRQTFIKVMSDSKDTTR